MMLSTDCHSPISGRLSSKRADEAEGGPPLTAGAFGRTGNP